MRPAVAPRADPSPNRPPWFRVSTQSLALLIRDVASKLRATQDSSGRNNYQWWFPMEAAGLVASMGHARSLDIRSAERGKHGKVL